MKSVDQRASTYTNPKYFVYKLNIQNKYAKIKRVEKVCHNNLPPLQVNKAKASALDK